jgi:hypothetical protein
MSLTEVVVGGTLKPDGTLELDQKPNLSPGRVQVVLRQESDKDLPAGDPFFDLLNSIWAGQHARGHVPRSAEQVEAERRQIREEWEERTREIERIQEESRRLRTETGRT